MPDDATTTVAYFNTSGALLETARNNVVKTQQGQHLSATIGNAQRARKRVVTSQPPVVLSRISPANMALLDQLNRISIAEIAVYTPALAIGVILSMRHGFGRSSGWLYLIIFSLARILGAALQLATINDPTNISLLIGASTLQSIGLGPLILIMLGLLSRVLESIRYTRDTFVTPKMLRIVQLVVLVGLVLGIVGGTQLGGIISNAVQTGETTYTMPTESVAGIALIIGGFGAVVIASAASALQISAAEPGEKRLLLALGLASPFVLVRLVFSGVATFDNNPNFRPYFGTRNYPAYLLGLAVVMEMVAVAIFEAIGLTVQKVQRPVAASGRMEDGIPLGRRGRHSRSPAKEEHRSAVEDA